MYRTISLTMLLSFFWASAQALESRPTACFSVLEDANLTIIHDSESGDKKEGEEEEEEPDCE